MREANQRNEMRRAQERTGEKRGQERKEESRSEMRLFTGDAHRLPATQVVGIVAQITTCRGHRAFL
jgi:hypothetical protein